MHDHTISGIVGATITTNNEPAQSYPFETKVIKMFDELLSEALFDTDEISTKICSQLTNDMEDMPSDVAACKLIYDVFYICKSHVVKLNAEYDLRKACDTSAQKSKDYLTGVIAPR